MNETFKGPTYEGFFNHAEWSSEPGQNFNLSLKKNMEEKGCILEQRDQLVAPVEGAFNVLCHGDPWFNNMLFK